MPKVPRNTDLLMPAVTPELQSAPPGWWSSKVPSEPFAKGTMDDLLMSIRSALTFSVIGKEIILGVPEDNEEVMDAIAKAGGEIRIVIRSAPRPMLELLSAANSSPIPTATNTTKVPELSGTFFTQ